MKQANIHKCLTKWYKTIIIWKQMLFDLIFHQSCLGFYCRMFSSMWRRIFQTDRGSVDRISLDRNCHFSLDRKFHFHLIEFHLIKIVIFHLIESFIFTWSNYLRLFTWSKVSIMHLIKRLKSCHLIKSFINDLIKWKNPSVLFWHLLKSSNNGILGF